MIKYNIGDRVVVIYDSIGLNNPLGKRGIITREHSFFKDVYYINFDYSTKQPAGDIYGQFSPSYFYSYEIELDKQYYRDNKLNSIL